MLKVIVGGALLFAGSILAPNIEAAGHTSYQMVLEFMPAPASYTDAVDRLEDFDRAFQAAVTGPGPNLIEVRI